MMFNMDSDLLGLGDWLVQLEGGRSGWSNDNSVLNVVEFLSESWSSDLHSPVGNGWGLQLWGKYFLIKVPHYPKLLFYLKSIFLSIFFTYGNIDEVLLHSMGVSELGHWNLYRK
jgi:hypothetical protein